MNSKISRYLMAYLFWVISVALAFIILLKWRSSVMIVLGVTNWNRYVEHALNQFGFLLLAILGLALIVFTEYFYRTGVEEKRLFARFFLITLIELFLLMLADLVYVIGGLMLDIVAPQNWLFLLVELGLCGVFYWLYRRTQPQVE